MAAGKLAAESIQSLLQLCHDCKQCGIKMSPNQNVPKQKSKLVNKNAQCLFVNMFVIPGIKWSSIMATLVDIVSWRGVVN